MWTLTPPLQSHRMGRKDIWFHLWESLQVDSFLWHLTALLLSLNSLGFILDTLGLTQPAPLALDTLIIVPQTGELFRLRDIFRLSQEPHRAGH